jgi:ubiquinone biosynthesis protein
VSFFTITAIGRTYRHVQRYRQILSSLFKYGFGDLIDSLKIEQYLDLGLQMISMVPAEKVQALSQAARVRLLLEELGPTFLKMGQILSTRPDLLPLAYLQELSKLQDEVTPFAFPEVETILSEEFKRPLSEVFSGFDEAPFAAASIGQVHKARLLDGELVAVKVQRPGVKRVIEVDLEIMTHLAGLMERHLEGFDIQRPTRIVQEFARALEKELDYTLEAANMERFARQFENEPGLHVPRVHREATTSRVLTMELINGVKASDLERLDRDGIDKVELAQRLLTLIMRQIFVHGFFHADPHPGNIFILPGGVVCYIDFGMMGRLGPELRDRFADLVMSIALRNERAATQALLKLAVTESEAEPDVAALENDVLDFMEQYCYRPLKDVQLGELLRRLVELTRTHHLRIRQNLYLMIKALSAVEGLGRRLDPELNVIEQAEPFIKRIQKNRLRPSRIAQDVALSGQEFLELLKDLPKEARALLALTKQGKVKVEFAHQGLEPLLVTLHQSCNRMAFAIVLASLVIGSGLIVHSGVPPKWHDIPIIGLAGFLVAGVMGLRLLFSIARGKSL